MHLCESGDQEGYRTGLRNGKCLFYCRAFRSLQACVLTHCCYNLLKSCLLWSHSLAFLHRTSLQPGDQDQFTWQVHKKLTGTCTKLLTTLHGDGWLSLASLLLENNPMENSLKPWKDQKTVLEGKVSAAFSKDNVYDY